jgi:hypothetical protein
MFDLSQSPSHRTAFRRAIDRASATARANITRLRETAALAFDRVRTYADRRVRAAIDRRVKPSIVAATVLAGVAVAVALISMLRK